MEGPLVQGSVSLLCTVYLFGGLGESERLSGTKSQMLLKKYLVEGREEQGFWSCRRDKRQSGGLEHISRRSQDLPLVLHIIFPKYQQWDLPGGGPTVPLGPFSALLCQQLPAPGSGQVGC